MNISSNNLNNTPKDNDPTRSKSIAQSQWTTESLQNNFATNNEKSSRDDRNTHHYLPVQEGPNEPSRIEYANELFDLYIKAINENNKKLADLYLKAYLDISSGIHWSE